MEIEYNNILNHIKYRPSKKVVMVSIPLYMYRVETNEFEHGLNFFQKVVLKFKANPSIKNEKISKLTGLNHQLIEMVSGELQQIGFLTVHGSLSEKGKEKLMEVDGLVVNSGKRKVGYVFKYLNQDKLYPYFIQKIEPADILKKKGERPEIIISTKGDGKDYTEKPFFIDELYTDELYTNKQIYNRPTERDVLQLIQNTNKKILKIQKKYGKYVGEQYVNEGTINQSIEQLNIRFLQDQPEIRWVCTYIYLDKDEDGNGDYYNSEWKILDPFGFEDSFSLKFYIQELRNTNLNTKINDTFSDAKTLAGKTIKEFNELINRQMKDKRLSDFSYSIQTLDTNLQIYIDAVLTSSIKLEQKSYNDYNESVLFSTSLQKALEIIFLQDRKSREHFYKSVYNELDGVFENKKQSLIKIYKQKLLSDNILVPKPIINVCRGSLQWGKTLLPYVASFILTYNYDNESILFKLLKNRIDTIVEIAQLRNEDQHAQLSSEREVRSLTKEEVLKYYNFFKDLINQYLTLISNGQEK